MPIGIISSEFVNEINSTSVDFEPLLSTLQGAIQA
jgi:hypothetical protein